MLIIYNKLLHNTILVMLQNDKLNYLIPYRLNMKLLVFLENIERVFSFLLR